VCFGIATLSLAACKDMTCVERGIEFVSNFYLNLMFLNVNNLGIKN